MPRQTAHVTVYRTNTCPYCSAAVSLLQSRGIAFETVDLDQHPDRPAFTAAIKAGHRTVPLIVIDDDPIGGYDALRAMDGRGELERRVFAAE